MTVEAAVKDGERNIAIACPGFTTDCLETIDEMGTEVRHLFTEAGGDKFALVPCLNAEPHWLDAMTEIIIDELGGWLNRPLLAGDSIRCPVDGRCASCESAA
jgi:ferrochelatase